MSQPQQPAPQYGPPSPGYAAEGQPPVYGAQGYGAQPYPGPQQTYAAPQQAHGAQPAEYPGPPQAYAVPQQAYGAQPQAYGAQSQAYGAQQYSGQQYPAQQYGAQSQAYGAPVHPVSGTALASPPQQAYGAQPQAYGAQQYSGQQYPAQQYGAQPQAYGVQAYGAQGYPAAGGAPATPQQQILSCRICGCVPAAEVKFRGHQGMLVVMRFLSNEGPFCRHCGLAVFRRMTSRTLVQGWWGYASFLMTPATVLLNLIRYPKISVLAEPQPNPYGQSSAPADPGPPLLARPLTWVGLAIPTALVVFLLYLGVTA